MLKKIFAIIIKIKSLKNSGSAIASTVGKESTFFYKMKLKLDAIKQNKKLYKFRFFLGITAIFTFLSVGAFYYYGNKSLYNAVENGHAALINMESDAVVVGNIIADQIAKEEQKKKFEEAQTKIVEEKKELDVKEEIHAEQYIAPSLSEDDEKKSKVVIIVEDLGLSKSMTLSALDLNQNFTLGFSPYAQDVGDWISQATDKGFEALIRLPMQPSDYPVNDPGPYAMLQNLSMGENLSRLDWVLARSKKVLGLYTSENETFTNSRSNITPVLENIARKNKILVYGNVANDSTIKALSESINLNYITSVMQIDSVLKEEDIKNSLLRLEGIALTEGKAVGYINSYPMSLRVLNNWIDEIDKSKLIVVPISKLFNIVPKSEESIIQYEKEELLQGTKEVQANTDSNAAESHDSHDAKPSAEGH